jgi:hypothetical protein
MKKSYNNPDHNGVESHEIESSQPPTKTDSNYYYDDSTGYEIYEDNEDEEKLEPGDEAG